MNKNFKILLITLLNNWNNFSGELENNSDIKLAIENQSLINQFKNNIPHINTTSNVLDLNDKIYPILYALVFASIFSFSIFIASLGLLFQDDLSSWDETQIETRLKITIIMGIIILIIGIILTFTKLSSYIFNGNKISFTHTLLTNIFIIILSMIFLFFYVYTLINNKLKDFYVLFYLLLPTISFIFILIITIYVIYETRQRIKKQLINPMMDSLYTKLIDVAFIFLSLCVVILFYCIAMINKKRFLYKSHCSGLISGTLYLIIILTVFKIRKMNIKDNLIILLSFFISYAFWEVFFILKKETSNGAKKTLDKKDSKIVASMMALQISFFASIFNALIKTKKLNKEFINNINSNIDNNSIV